MNGILEIRSSLLKTTNDSRVGICESEVNSSTYMYIHVKEQIIKISSNYLVSVI